LAAPLRSTDLVSADAVLHWISRYREHPRPGDVPAIKTILEANQLPVAGVDEHWRTFLIAREGEKVIGCGGA